ncbi:MAG: hypothetical protein IT555_21325 [Acetobacteraceae bacterium]|nr:hypothetical protein [Acetobacteraceae bacterium]
MFFFEKKNQKTSVPWHSGANRRTTDEVFLLLFLQKKKAFLAHPATPLFSPAAIVV